MEPEYPIFVLTTDDLSMEMHTSGKTLNCYEKQDIAGGLYKGWDAHGRPLELFWDAKQRRPHAIVSGESKQLEELRNAILDYARQYKPASPFQPTGTEESIVELFEAVERHLKTSK